MSSSAVVISYRPGPWLGPCLDSVRHQVDELLLIDNGSPGHQASDIGRHHGARVLRSPVNRGFAPAANIGASMAKGDILALLNDDAQAPPGWLEAAALVLAQPAVAAVGPKVVLATAYQEVKLEDEPWRAPGDWRPLGRQLSAVTVDGRSVLAEAVGPGLHRVETGADGATWRWTAGREPWYVPLPDQAGAGEVRVNGEPVPAGPVVRLVNSAGGFLDHRGYSGDIGADQVDDGRFGSLTERFSLSGAALVMRMATWKALGPFASPFFAYYEDTDWCWRARLAGMTLVYDPSVTVVHQRSSSSGGKRDRRVRVMAERNRTLTMVRSGPASLAAKAVAARAQGGPDGGVRAGVARLLPWAAATRLELARRWLLKPEDVWRTWAGVDAPPPE